MDMENIYADSAFSAAVVPSGQLLVFTGYDTGVSGGNIVTRYKDSSGNFGNLSGGGGGGGGQTDFYKCASVNTSNQTWTGYKAVLNNGIYTFEGTATTGLTYDNVTPSVGGIYTDGTLVTVKMLWDGIPSDGLIRYAPLSASAAVDALGYGLGSDGTITFSTVSGVPCAGMGQDALIYYSDGISTSNLFTLSAWMKATSSEADAIITLSGGSYGSYGNEIWLILKPTLFTLGNGAASGAEIYQTSTSGGWYLIAVSWTGSAFNVYINGTKVQSAIGTGNDFSESLHLYINSLYRAPEIVRGIGQYSSVRLYNKVLSDAEVALLAAEFSPTA